MLAENGARDYKGQKLCTMCWNGKHHHCEHGACECCCEALKANKAELSNKLRSAKPKPKKKQPIDWDERLEDWERIHGKRPVESAV
jgi:hypothetical protein